MDQYAKGGVLKAAASVVASVFESDALTRKEWLVLTLLEAPAVAVSLRQALAGWLEGHGIWHSLEGLRNPGALSSGLLLALHWGRDRRDRLLPLLLESLSKMNCRASASDAMLLAVCWSEEVMGSAGGSAFRPCLDLGRWIADPASMPGLPSGAVAGEWFAAPAFRGVRRRMARDRGFEAGMARCCRAPVWLKPTGDGPMPAGAAAMLAEYALAAVRARDDWARELFGAAEKIENEIKRVTAEYRDILRKADSVENLRWLESAMRETQSEWQL